MKQAIIKNTEYRRNSGGERQRKLGSFVRERKLMMVSGGENIKKMKLFRNEHCVHLKNKSTVL